METLMDDSAARPLFCHEPSLRRQESTTATRQGRRRLSLGLLSATAMAGLPAIGHSQSDRPVSLVVPLAPGGIADVTARPLAIPLARELGQPVIVENRVGAGGATGMAYVARQKPDGQTLLLALSSAVVIPLVNKAAGKPSVYEMSNFTPISLVSADPTVLAVRADSPYHTIEDVLRAARKDPNKITYSTSGMYGTTHICQLMLWQAAKVDMLHVPYNGGGPSLMALLSGEVELNAQAPGLLVPHLQAGKVRILGTWGATRLPAFPEVPTFREAGFDVEFYIWSALLAPAGLTPAKLAELQRAARRSVNDPEFVRAMTARSTPLRYLEGPELDAFLKNDETRMAKVVQAMGKIE